MPDPLKTEALHAIAGALAGANVRNRLAAVKLMLTMTRADQADDAAGRGNETLTAADAVKAMEAAAAEYERTGGGSDGTEGVPE